MNHSMSNDHMNADRFQAFLEEELPPRDLVRVEEHLADCARCSAELDAWRMLFDDLGALPSYRPREGFADRVMTDVRVPEPLPLAARVRTRWAAPKRVTEHVGDGVLQDFLEGTLAARESARVGQHLEACTACTSEADAWLVMMRRLDGLDTFAPKDGFAERVMAVVDLPVARPLAARIRQRLTELLGGHVSEHVPAGVLQDFVDGLLPARAVARVEVHVTGCATCASEAEDWRTVMAHLETLERLTPQQGFADQVMARVQVPQRATSVATLPIWSNVLAAAARLVPQTHEAWAAVSGVAVTPAVTVGLILYVVSSHPTLTLGSLASFAWWQVTDLGSMALSGLSAAVLQSGELFSVYSLFETLASAPLMVAGGFLTYSMASALALRVLYRNLVANRAVNAHYAYVSAS